MVWYQIYGRVAIPSSVDLTGVDHYEVDIDNYSPGTKGADYAVPHYDTPEGVKVPAAWLIEQCGFKGKRLGGAGVYRHQPLLIINESGHASAEDILGLERQVIAAVLAKYAITLRPEVEHI